MRQSLPQRRQALRKERLGNRRVRMEGFERVVGAFDGIEFAWYAGLG